jgi:hypothetical protein
MHMYIEWTLKIKFKITFPFDMLMEELDAQRSDLLPYYFKFYDNNTL